LHKNFLDSRSDRLGFLEGP